MSMSGQGYNPMSGMGGYGGGFGSGYMTPINWGAGYQQPMNTGYGRGGFGMGLQQQPMTPFDQAFGTRPPPFIPGGAPGPAQAGAGTAANTAPVPKATPYDPNQGFLGGFNTLQRNPNQGFLGGFNKGY